MTDNTKILLVDDEEIATQFLKKELEKRGCIVDWAKTSQEAIQLIDANGHARYYFDLRLENSEMSGIELIEHLAKTKPISMMAVVTAYRHGEDALKAMKMGITAIIEKTIPSDIMINQIMGFLTQRI